MHRTRPFRRVLLASFILVLGLRVLAADKLIGIPLVWKPTDTKGGGVINLTGLTDVKIRIDPFTDTRTDLAKFGENQEDKTPKPVTTSGSVAEFCTQNVQKLLKQFGFSVVPDGGDFALSGEVVEFMVIETNTYKGEARFKLTLRRGNNVEWTGVAAGTASHFGRSLRAENYYETISDSVLSAVRNIAQDEAFRAALGGKSK